MHCVKPTRPCLPRCRGRCRQQEWVVHCQPLGRGEKALKYLAPYIFREAISNRRIVKLQHGQVTFRYRQTESGKLKSCTLRAAEFIRCFLQRVLPKGLVNVRYYGFLAVGQRKRWAALRAQLSRPLEETSSASAETPEKEQRRSHRSEVPCPSCGHVMQRGAVVRPTAHGPP